MAPSVVRTRDSVTCGGPAGAVVFVAGPVRVAAGSARGAVGGFVAADVQAATHIAAHIAAQLAAQLAGTDFPRHRGLRVTRKGCKTTVNGR